MWIAAIRFAVAIASTLLAPIGYTADELYYLACADHLAWGYVDHPSLSIAVLAAVRRTQHSPYPPRTRLHYAALRCTAPQYT